MIQLISQCIFRIFGIVFLLFINNTRRVYAAYTVVCVLLMMGFAQAQLVSQERILLFYNYFDVKDNNDVRVELHSCNNSDRTILAEFRSVLRVVVIKQKIFPASEAVSVCDFSESKIVFSNGHFLQLNGKLILIPVLQKQHMSFSGRTESVFYFSNEYKDFIATHEYRNQYKIIFNHIQYQIENFHITYQTPEIKTEKKYHICGQDSTLRDLLARYAYFDRIFGFENGLVAIRSDVYQSLDSEFRKVCEMRGR